jgi:hypothetical protein
MAEPYTCITCQGSGADPDDPTEPCDACDGTGEVDEGGYPYEAPPDTDRDPVPYGDGYSYGREGR